MLGLEPFPPLTAEERKILEEISREYHKIYSSEFAGLPAVSQGGLPAVARYIARMQS